MSQCRDKQLVATAMDRHTIAASVNMFKPIALLLKTYVSRESVSPPKLHLLLQQARCGWHEARSTCTTLKHYPRINSLMPINLPLLLSAAGQLWGPMLHVLPHTQVLQQLVMKVFILISTKQRTLCLRQRLELSACSPFLFPCMVYFSFSAAPGF
jgi:hypothetical protein